MATDTEKPEADTQVDDQPASAVAESANEQQQSQQPQSQPEEDPAATKVKLKEVGKEKPEGGSLVGKLLAVLVFAAVVGGAYAFLQGGLVVEAPTKPVEAEEMKLDLDPSLSARELLQVGQNALDEGNLDEASRLFEGARLRADLESANDINLTVDVYEGLARVEAAKGNDSVAEMFREYIRSKQSELGESLPLFNKAERLFREGKQVEARKHYAQFLLMANSLDEGGKRYVEIAKRHLADSFEIEFRERYQKNAPKSLINPEEFFHEVR